MGLRRPSLSSVSTKPYRRTFRFAYRIPPARWRHDTDLSWNFRAAVSAAGAFARGCRIANRRSRPRRCNVVRERRTAPRRISATALERPPGDFCREAAIVHARFGFALVAQLDRASDFESEGREFESLRARQEDQWLMTVSCTSCFPEIELGKHMGSKQKIIVGFTAICSIGNASTPLPAALVRRRTVCLLCRARPRRTGARLCLFRG
jgi:hypothetical protein